MSILAARISAEATGATRIPPNAQPWDTTMTQVDAIVKMEGPITKFQAPRKRDSDMEALVSRVMGVTVVLASVIAIVVTMMVEFCGGLWLR